MSRLTDRVARMEQKLERLREHENTRIIISGGAGIPDKVIDFKRPATTTTRKRKGRAKPHE